MCRGENDPRIPHFGGSLLRSLFFSKEGEGGMCLQTCNKVSNLISLI